MTTFPQNKEPVIPSEADTQLSQLGSRILAAYFQRVRTSTQKIKLVESNGNEQVVEIPFVAFQLLFEILEQIAQGKAITLIPINAELTTQEAAQLLNVSRPYLTKLLKSGEIPFHQIGRHQHIRFEDVMKYKKWIDNERLKVLDELAFQAQELNMGYE